MSFNVSSLAAYHSNVQVRPSTLWYQIVRRTPEVLNAAHYYVYDVQRLSRAMMGALTTTTVPQIPPPSNSITSTKDSLLADSVEVLGESEVHYQSAPAVSAVVTIHSVDMSLCDGVMFLSLCVDLGIAVFEVKDCGVYEVFVDLAVRHAPVRSVKPLHGGLLAVLTSKTLSLVHLQRAPLLDRMRTTSVELAFEAVEMRVMRQCIVLRTCEFSQLILYNLNTLKEMQCILTDAPVVAASSRWLAYCSAPREVLSSQVVVRKRQESASVLAGSLVSKLAQGLWGTSPNLQAQQQPSGFCSVVLYDVEDGKEFSSFVPHNHTLQCMAFDPSGILLATASTAGTTVNVFQVLRSASTSGGGSKSAPGIVTLMYRLLRGVTHGVITSISFNPLGRSIAVATAIGTVHVFNTAEKDRHSSEGLCSCDHVATQLTASFRARSAPSTSAPNPSVVLNGIASSSKRWGNNNTRDSRSSVLCAIASSSGMVTLLRYDSDSDTGAVKLYTQYIDSFRGSSIPEDTVEVVPLLSSPMVEQQQEKASVLQRQLEAAHGQPQGDNFLSMR